MSSAPWIVLLSIAAYGLVHSLLASLYVKALSRRWLGDWIGRFYRLIFNAIGFLTLLPVITLMAYLPDRPIYTIHFPWAIFTLAIQALAGLTLVIGVLQTGALDFLGLRQLLSYREDSQPRLVTNGLYRWVRHPLYSAGLVIIWLSPRMTVNILAFNAGLTLYILIGAMLEERKLAREFGEVYLQYCQRTPMLIPGIKLL